MNPIWERDIEIKKAQQKRIEKLCEYLNFMAHLYKANKPNFDNDDARMVDQCIEMAKPQILHLDIKIEFGSCEVIL